MYIYLSVYVSVVEWMHPCVFDKTMQPFHTIYNKLCFISFLNALHYANLKFLVYARWILYNNYSLCSNPIGWHFIKNIKSQNFKPKQKHQPNQIFKKQITKKESW